jgi:hypothetical protein
MTEPLKTTEQVDDAITLAREAQDLLDRAKAKGVTLPAEFEEKASAFITLDAPKTTNIAKALALDEAAGEAQILRAIADLKVPPDLKTLEAVAGTHGMLFLSVDEKTDLERRAAQGDKALSDLHEQQFALAFDKAQFAGRVDARPETRELHRAIFDSDPALAIRNLASLPQVVNVLTREDVTTVEHAEADPDIPDGYDADSFLLDRKAKAYMVEHPEVTYLAAVEAVA